MGLMPLFKPAARYPADPRVVFLLAISAFSGITALALESAPQSLDSLLPPWAVVTWGVLLALGSMLTLAGIPIKSLNGIILEQVGSVMIAATTVFYSAIAFWVVGNDAFSVVGIILAWGLACGFRWFQLQALIKDAYRKEIHHKIEQRVRTELGDR